MLHFRVDSTRTRSVSGVVEQLSVPTLLCSSCIDKCVKSFLLGKQKTVLYSSPAVFIIIVYESEINNGNSPTQEDALLNLQAASEADTVDITLSRGICLKSHRETSVIVSSKTAGIFEVHTHGNVSKRHACMFSRGIIDMYPDRPFFVNATNSIALEAPQKIVHIKDECFS